MLNWWLRPPRIQILTLLWSGVILVLSALPGKDLPRIDLINADKFAHAFVYGLLYVLISYWISPKNERKYPWISASIAIAYGLLMEFMQDSFFTERFFDWWDALANSIGVLLGIVIFRYIR